MTIKEMEERRIKLGLSWERLAELSGLSEEMVRSILENAENRNTEMDHEGKGSDEKTYAGENRAESDTRKSFSYAHLLSLERVLTDGLDIVREKPVVYGTGKCQGKFTLEDYCQLPEDQRVELIDGVFYDMSAPTHIHQILGGKIFRRFSEYIERNRGECVAAYAPLDVQLDCDERTMVQPDVMIVCDREKFQRGIVYGAPDLVVEILSNSSRKKNSYIKLEKYAGAGVREYWLVDPEKKKVIVYDLEQEEYPAIYGFEDTVPVRIFHGKCSVDFREIMEDMKFLYGRL